MLTTLLSTYAESQGIRISIDAHLGPRGTFDRYLRPLFTLPDEASRQTFSTLQPLWQGPAEQKESTRLRKMVQENTDGLTSVHQMTIIHKIYEIFL